MTDDAAKPNRAAERSAARGSQSAPENVPEEVRYHVDALYEDAPHLLRVSRHAVVGALSGSEKKTYTLDEAKEAIDEFLNREVH